MVYILWAGPAGESSLCIIRKSNQKASWEFEGSADVAHGLCWNEVGEGSPPGPRWLSPPASGPADLEAVPPVRDSQPCGSASQYVLSQLASLPPSAKMCRTVSPPAVAVDPCLSGSGAQNQLMCHHDQSLCAVLQFVDVIHICLSICF